MTDALHSQIWSNGLTALSCLKNGEIDAIVWNATSEIRARNMRYCPNKRTIYIKGPYPKELTNVQ